MNKIELGDLIMPGIIPVTQEVEVYLVSFSKDAAFRGLAKDIPQGYFNFTVTGLMVEEDILKIRMKIA